MPTETPPTDTPRNPRLTTTRNTRAPMTTTAAACGVSRRLDFISGFSFIEFPLDEHAASNGNVVRQNLERPRAGSLELEFQTSRSESRKPQIPVLVTQRPIEFMGEVIDPDTVVHFSR